MEDEKKEDANPHVKIRDAQPKHERNKKHDEDKKEWKGLDIIVSK